ncbi:MAG: hypothetical protein IJ614_00095, partial [Prevotella sp.]|nr:hypothetical protein [Prevotella sp.]
KVFSAKYYPLAGVEISPKPLGAPKLCHSNLRFTFAAGTIKHQAIGRQNAVVRETDYASLATPLRSCSWQRT